MSLLMRIRVTAPNISAVAAVVFNSSKVDRKMMMLNDTLYYSTNSRVRDCCGIHFFLLLKLLLYLELLINSGSVFTHILLETQLTLSTIRSSKPVLAELENIRFSCYCKLRNMTRGQNSLICINSKLRYLIKLNSPNQNVESKLFCNIFYNP